MTLEEELYVLTGHSYVPPLSRPRSKTMPFWKSLTINKCGKNSIEALLAWQNLETNKILCVMWGAHKPSYKTKEEEGELRSTKPICVIMWVLPLPTTISSGPIYLEWLAKFWRFDVTWWDALESINQFIKDQSSMLVEGMESGWKRNIVKMVKITIVARTETSIM